VADLLSLSKQSCEFTLFIEYLTRCDWLYCPLIEAHIRAPPSIAASDSFLTSTKLNSRQSTALTS
jgi:hypothetical protein